MAWRWRRSSSTPVSPLDLVEQPLPEATLHTRCTEGRFAADVWAVGGGCGGGADTACKSPVDPRGRVPVSHIGTGRRRSTVDGTRDMKDVGLVVCTGIACFRDVSCLLQLLSCDDILFTC